MSSSNNRLDTFEPSTLTGSARERHDEWYNFAHGAFGDSGKVTHYTDPQTGAMIGPFPAYQTLPEYWKPGLEQMKAMGKFPGITPEARETAILVTAAHYKAAYPLYAHINIAVKATALTQEQVDAMVKQQQKPQGLSSVADLAYDVAYSLTHSPGPLPQDLWDRGEKECGSREGILGLVHYVGFYAQVCIIVNAVDAPAPE